MEKQILKIDDDDFGSFCEEMNLFYETVRKAGLSVIDDWVKRGLIDEEDVEELVEHFNEKVNYILPDNM